VKQVMGKGQVDILVDRSFAIGAVRFVACTNLKDEWFAIGLGSAQEPDLLLNCILKTEFFTHLHNASRGSAQLRIGPNIEYNKKPGKAAIVKSLKDPKLPLQPPGEVFYKSSTIHASAGEPPNSVSKPTPKAKVLARPITSGKLLKPGGPSGRPSKLASRPARDTSRPITTPVAAPLVAASNGFSSASSGRPAPPPPPPPPLQSQASSDPTCKALWDFAGQSKGEMSVKKGEIVIIVKKENNGWWLARPRGSSPEDTSVQGWVPSAYVEEIKPTAYAPPPPPPPPPPPAASRPVPTPNVMNNGMNGGRPLGGKPTPPVPPSKRPAKRASAVGSEPVAGGNSMAGSLAEALKARQAAMGGGKKKEDGDW